MPPGAYSHIWQVSIYGFFLILVDQSPVRVERSLIRVRFDSVPLAEIRIDSLTEKRKNDIFSEHGYDASMIDGLQGVDVYPTHEKEGTMVTMERPGTTVEAHSSGCSYH